MVNHCCLIIDNLIPDIKNNNTIPTLGGETHNAVLMSGTIIGYNRGKQNHQTKRLNDKKDLSGLGDFYVL